MSVEQFYDNPRRPLLLLCANDMTFSPKLIIGFCPTKIGVSWIQTQRSQNFLFYQTKVIMISVNISIILKQSSPTLFWTNRNNHYLELWDISTHSVMSILVHKSKHNSEFSFLINRLWEFGLQKFKLMKKLRKC